MASHGGCAVSEVGQASLEYSEAEALDWLSKTGFVRSTVPLVTIERRIRGRQRAFHQNSNSNWHLQQ